jgi:hypothetical protein
MTAHDRSIAHDAANRERFALRRAERYAAAEVCELERRLDSFERHLEAVNELLVVEFRREHWGREPPRRLARQALAHQAGSAIAAQGETRSAIRLGPSSAARHLVHATGR